MKTFLELEISHLQKEIKELNEERSKLYLETMTDDLTGLLNARAMKMALAYRLNKLRSVKRATGLIFIDVDQFKQVNERHGHLVGSHVLSQVGALIRSFLPEGTLGYRFGGDEFVLLVDGDVLHTQQVGEMVRSLVESHIFKVKGFRGDDKVSVTLSLGLSMLHESETADSLVERANKAMFEAKRASRNRLVIAA